MNLVEALRTGKPLRRPISKHKGSSRSGWLGNEFVKSYLTSHNNWQQYFGGSYAHYNLVDDVDLLANDWEIKHE